MIRLTDRGFSLLETIMAAGLSAFLLVMVYTTYVGINSAISAASEVQEVLEAGRILMELQRQDIRGMKPVTKAPLKSEVKELSGELYYTLEFSTTSLLGENPFGYGKVGYALVKTADGGKVLVRRELTDMKEDLWKLGTTFEVSQMVTSFELRFYNGKDWVETWDSVKMGKHPQQVRIVVTLVDERGNKRTFTADEAVPTAL